MVDFVAIDVETAHGKRWSICQIGMVKVEAGNIVDTYDKLVQPPGNEYFYRNIQIHGITPEDTANSPFFNQLWNEIKAFIGDKMLVAHNAAFDMDCLRKTLGYYNLDVPDFKSDCTYKRSGMKLDLACKTYHIRLDNHHNALADSIACAQLFLKLNNK